MCLHSCIIPSIEALYMCLGALSLWQLPTIRLDLSHGTKRLTRLISVYALHCLTSRKCCLTIKRFEGDLWQADENCANIYPWPVQYIGQTRKHCCCIGLWINISPLVFAAQAKASPGYTGHILGQMNIHISVSRTSQSPSCRPRIFAKYAPTPLAPGVLTEAAICSGHYFHI